MSLFVGQLSHEMHTHELKEIFEEFGRLGRCELKSGRRSDYAFLTFENERDAEDALNNLNGKEFFGLRINVEWAKGGKPRARSNECYECGEPGHFARDCPRKYRSPRRYRSPPRRGYYRDSRSPSPRRSRYSPSPRRYDRSPPGRYRSPSPRRQRSFSRSRSPVRRDSRSPQRTRGSRSPARRNTRSPDRSRGRSRTPSPRTPLKRPLESPTGEEPPEKMSRND